MKITFGHHCLRILLSLTLVIGFPEPCGSSSFSPKHNAKHESVHIHGNITLGGLFPIHSANEAGRCTGINGILGIQRLEAMLFAVKRINQEKKILPGIQLGVSAFDTCASETTALDRTVEEFITDQKCDSMGNEGVIGGRQVVGVIGPLYSSVAVQVAHLLRLFKMPQISYDSTSSELSDKTKYEYFLRTAPSDSLQARAITDILKHFNWSYVSVLYSDDNYGRKGIEAMSSEADKNGICIAVRERIPYPSNNKTFSSIIKKLVREEKAQVVIIFCSKKETITHLLLEAQAQRVVEKFQWIGSDSWLTVSWLGELQPLVRGLISVRPKSDPYKQFETYMFRRMPSSTDVNPWFREFFRQTVKCNPLSYTAADKYDYCTSEQSLRTANMTIDSGVSRTINAVYAFAHVLRKIRETKCGKSSGICPEMKKTSGKELLTVLKDIQFTSIGGETVSFDEKGDAPARYDVYFFNESKTGVYKNVRIGEWSHNLTMYPAARDTFQARNSFCGVPCKANEVKRSKSGKPSCCWECVVCPGNTIASNQTHCKTCALGFWPDDSRGKCVALLARYFTLNRDHVGLHLVLPPFVVSVLGIITVVFIMVIFIKYNRTPLVKASGRELSFLLLTGLFFCYCVLIVCLMKPSPYVCLVEFILDSLSFTVCYAAVIVKTNRISRIFNRRNVSKRPQFIHPQSQICFSLSLVAVQVMLLTAFCLLQLPRAKLVYLSASDIVLICAISDKDFLLSQIYNFVLIIICTYYAFKTRRSPMNFNEAKYIAFAMYCTCVLWLAFITVYLVQTDVMLKTCIRCLSVSLIATILLVSLFVPKVYIIILKPSENRKRATLPSHSISSLTGEQGAPRPPHDHNKPRDWTPSGNGDKNDGTLQRSAYRPRSSTDPRRLDSERRSWRYSLPPEQYSQSTEPQKLDNEEEMELEMKALIERLSVLEALLHQQRQASGSYQTREIQGTLKSCQGLIAEVKKQSKCSIPECLEEGEDDCACQNTEEAKTKPDNRSLLMTYAQTENNAGQPRNFIEPQASKNVDSQHKKTNGSTFPTASASDTFRNAPAKANNDKIHLLQYPMSPLKRSSTSDA